VARPRRPVVLVHGILGQPHLYWNLFRRRLAADGFRVHEASLPFALLGDVVLAAQALAERVEQVRAQEQAQQVDLVCHSAGGLAARHYVKFLGGHLRVHHVVHLGTPHGGTWFGYAMPLLRVAAQARPGSEFLRALDDGQDPPVRVTNLWSPIDGVVVPAANSMLDRPGVRNVRVPWVHHWGFLVSPRVYAHVRDALLRPEGNARRRRPGPGSPAPGGAP
jgi:triacylglycerol lipase